MKNLIKPVCIASLFLLSACGEQGVKLQVEPTLPVPVLVVPDHGNNPNNNQINNPNPYPRNDQSQPYPYNKDSQYYKRRRGNNDGRGYDNQQYENNDQPDYR